MIRVASLGYVGVESPKHSVWNEIGPEVFAFQLGQPGSDGAVRFKIDDNAYRISIHPGERNRVSYQGWELASYEEFGNAQEELARQNIPYKVADAGECADRLVGEMLYFQSPAGFRYELFVLPSRRDDSFLPPRPHSGFQTGDQGLGHVNVVVPDGEAEHRMLVDVLGAKVSDAVIVGGGDAMRFYRVNPRHHSTAHMVVPGMRGLQHIMVEAKEIDDVGRAYTLAKRHPELKVTAELGRHMGDMMLSFYVRTPSGWDLEYGYGGLRVSDERTPGMLQAPAEYWGHEYDPMFFDFQALEPAD
ncbi:VOC family protein [Streptomyces sp900105755]|uniref:VOC family protein n=1 Tax=Streptomyces sp. 900105755 TaxID=3154389 RepID=UPI003322E648